MKRGAVLGHGEGWWHLAKDNFSWVDTCKRLT